MLPDRVSNPGPLTYESGALPIALRGPAISKDFCKKISTKLQCKNCSIHICVENYVLSWWRQFVVVFYCKDCHKHKRDYKR